MTCSCCFKEFFRYLSCSLRFVFRFTSWGTVSARVDLRIMKDLRLDWEGKGGREEGREGGKADGLR
jgi:hypothetical protein